MLARFCVLILATTAAANAAPLTVPFDFSRNAIGLSVTVKDQPLYVILDTGVDPSAIDAHRAEALGLKIDRARGGEASGEGSAKEAKVYPTTIDGLALKGRDFPPIDALTLDMKLLSARYGRTLDGVLGFSFLAGRIVLIDYARRELSILDAPSDATARVRPCRKHWTIPYKSYAGDSIPIVPDFRFGAATAHISLDTGSNRDIGVYQSALDLPGFRAALKEAGQTSFAGARGVGRGKLYRFDAPVGFGPFALPKGQILTLHPEKGSRATRVANIGNRFFAAVTPVMLLDYKDRVISFYGDCR